MRVLVFGEPKSGTTALMRAATDALGGATEVLEPPDLNEVDFSPDPLVVKRLFGRHHREERPAFDRFDARFLIVRDPRDRLISWLLYDIVGRTEADDPKRIAPFLDMLEAKHADPCSIPFLELHHAYWQITGVDMLSSAIRSSQRLRTFWRNRGKKRWTLVRYEDFVAGRTDEVAAALGVERLGSPTITGDLSRVERTRESGSWKLWFTDVDRLYFEPLCSGFFEELGYETDWELAPEPRIDRAHGIDYVLHLIESGHALRSS